MTGSSFGKTTQGKTIELVALSAAFVPVAAALHAQGFEDCWDEDALLRLLDVPGAFGLLAFQPGESAQNGADIPLGFVLIQAVVDEAEINTIVVAPSARGMGVAKKLIAGAEKRLRAEGVTRMLLEVAIDNDPALKLYQGYGFNKVGHRKGYYDRHDGRKVDALVLEHVFAQDGSNG